MFKNSKINWFLVFLIGFIILPGFCIVTWTQVKEELKGKFGENENLIEEVNKLGSHLQRLQTTIKKMEIAEGIKEPVVKKNGEDITITTDKTQYRQGEIVKITIRNNSDKVIFGGYCLPELGIWEIEKFEKDIWINLRGETIRGLWLPKLENGKETCKSHYSPEQPLCRKRWEPYSEISQEWNQKICLHYGDTPLLIEKGIYRLIFVYGYEIHGGWIEAGRWYGKIKDPKIIYSNTFIIK